MIVVVDDHLDSATALARLLTRVGLEAVAKSCAKDLFDYLSSSPRPSLVILDLAMPETDGLDCLKAIRSHTEWKEVPVVVYSADFSHEKMRECQRLGAQEFIVKGTMRWDDFFAAIKRHAAPAAA